MKKKTIVFIFLLLGIHAYSQTQKELGKIYKSTLKSFLENGYQGMVLANRTVDMELQLLDSVLLEQLSIKAGFTPDSSWRSFYQSIAAKVRLLREQALPRSWDLMIHEITISPTSSIQIPFNTDERKKFNEMFPGAIGLVKVSNIIFSDDHSRGIVQINIWYKDRGTGEGYCMFLKPAKHNKWEEYAEALIWNGDF